ncbi:hypothetical protein [Leifsonia xyli]|uniref:hypothetical protein n=1 Tax=Leifsonia xyli TaxID=1575 RepID=UPI003D67CA28
MKDDLPQLVQLREHIRVVGDFVHFSVVPRYGGAYDIALVIDGGYGFQDAERIGRWFAEKNEIPFRLDSTDY